ASSSQDVLRLHSNGPVSSAEFSVLGNTRIGLLSWFGQFRLMNSLATTAVTLQDDGSWSTPSDQRLKTEITPAAGLLDKALALRPVEFYVKNQDCARDPDKHVGLIAQEVQPLFPSLVHASNDDLLTLNYDRIGVVAIGAIQEQQRIIRDQIRKIAEQEQMILDQKRDLAEMAAAIERLSARMNELAPSCGPVVTSQIQ